MGEWCACDGRVVGVPPWPPPYPPACRAARRRSACCRSSWRRCRPAEGAKEHDQMRYIRGTEVASLTRWPLPLLVFNGVAGQEKQPAVAVPRQRLRECLGRASKAPQGRRGERGGVSDVSLDTSTQTCSVGTLTSRPSLAYSQSPPTPTTRFVSQSRSTYREAQGRVRSEHGFAASLGSSRSTSGERSTTTSPRARRPVAAASAGEGGSGGSAGEGGSGGGGEGGGEGGASVAREPITRWPMRRRCSMRGRAAWQTAPRNSDTRSIRMEEPVWNVGAMLLPATLAVRSSCETMPSTAAVAAAAATPTACDMYFAQEDGLSRRAEGFRSLARFSFSV